MDAMRAQPTMALAGTPGGSARAAMLRALVDGTWRPVGELARAAGISAVVAAALLEAMAAAGELARLGGVRRPYYGLADPARTRRQLARAPGAPIAIPPATRDAALRAARTCYGHLAGHLGVAVCDGWRKHGWLGTDPQSFRLQPVAAAALVEAGWPRADALRLTTLTGRPCVDWTERRIHLGGPLGKALAQEMAALGWFRRIGTTRAIVLTASGSRRLATLGVRVPAGG